MTPNRKYLQDRAIDTAVEELMEDLQRDATQGVPGLSPDELARLPVDDLTSEIDG